MLAHQTRRIAAALLAATGALHLALAPEYLGEKAYIGALFILGGITAIAVAVRLWITDDARAWTLGALIAVGMAAGFILSRSVGLPGFHESDWELSGIVSVALELGFIGALVSHTRAPSSALARPASS